MKELLGSLRRHYYPLLALGAVWSSYFSILFGQTLRLQPNGLYAGTQAVWGDWSLHIAIANLFAYKEPQYWFSSHPVFAGAKFTYPFVADLVSGMLMRLHIPLPAALILPSFICTMLLILAVYAISYILSDSTVVASISASLFFLLGGFVPYIIIYQRAFLLGTTASFWSLAGLLFVLAKPEEYPTKQRVILLISAILAGILPVTHPHAFIALIIVAGCMCVAFIKRWRLLLWYVVPASLFSSLLFFKFIYGGIQDPSFLSWLPGSLWGGGLWGWVCQSGNQILLASAGWFTLTKTRLTRSFCLGIAIVFLLSNLFLFQPNPADNGKLLCWTNVGFSFLAGSFLCWLLQRKWVLEKITAVLIVCAQVIPIVYVLPAIANADYKDNLMTSADDMRLGRDIREHTNATDLFLTDDPSRPNDMVMMWTARPILMGFTEWLHSYGILYEPRMRDITAMYNGGAYAEELLRKYQVSYVVVGPSGERSYQINESYFTSQFPVAFRNASYTVYDVRLLFTAKQ